MLSDVGHEVIDVGLVPRPTVLRPVRPSVCRIVARVVRVPLDFHPTESHPLHKVLETPVRGLLSTNTKEWDFPFIF